MGCCKCKEYEWPDPQQPVWVDIVDNHKKYCTFHSPLGRKNCSPQKFQELVNIRLQHPTPNTPLLFDGTIFEHAVYFDIAINTPYTRALSLKNCHFHECISISSSKNSLELEILNLNKDNLDNLTNIDETPKIEPSLFFPAFIPKANIYISNSIFNKGIIISDLSIKNVFHSKNNTFDGKSYFRRLEFSNISAFENCEFNASFEFQICIFSNQFHFAFNDITDAVHFRHAHFKSTPSFVHTSFDKLNFSNITWPINEHGYICHNTEIDDSLAIEFYRHQKRTNIAMNNSTEASFWHIAEKHSQLNTLREHHDKTLLRASLEAYRFISFFGESPGRALQILLLLMFILACTMFLGSMAIKGKGHFTFTFEAASNFILAFTQFILLDKPGYYMHPLATSAALFFSRLLIPIQAAIFAFALRNKLHR